MKLHQLPPEIRRLANEAKIAFDRHNGHEPTVRAFFPTGSMAAIPVSNWMKPGPTRKLITEMMILAVRAKAHTVALISEVWQATAVESDTATVRAATLGLVHTLPKRKEALIITADTETMTFLVTAPIIREKNRAKLGKWEVVSAQTVDSYDEDRIASEKVTGEDMSSRFQDIWRKSREWGELNLERMMKEKPELFKIFEWLRNA